MNRFKDTPILDLIGMERRAERDARFYKGFALGMGLTALVTMAGAPAEQNIAIPATFAAAALGAFGFGWFAGIASRVLMKEILARIGGPQGSDGEVP